MNYIDIVLLAVVFISVWFDLRRGFIFSSLILLSWIGSLVVGFLTYDFINDFLQKTIPVIGFWSTPLSFILVIIIARFALDKVVSKLLDKVPERTHDHIINRFLGVIPGIINGFIWAALLATTFLLMPLTRVSELTRDSRLAESLITEVSWLETKLAPIFTEALNKTINRKPVADDVEGTIKLPFIIKDPKTRPDLEAEMLNLLNQERAKKGLKLLKADPEIAVVARKHSADMFVRGYFSHYTPEGIDPFGRMKKDHIIFFTAGENLAIAQTLSIAHTGLMNSPGHRANILNPAFGRVGIGILDGGIYGLMITQNFRN